MKRLLLLLALFAVTAMAADITGSWKGSAETAKGTLERTFVFKVNGKQLTGETSSEKLGKSAIRDGRVNGDNISFTITTKVRGSDMVIKYTGKVNGQEIKLKALVAATGQVVNYTVQRIS